MTRFVVINPKEKTVTETDIEPTLANLRQIVGGAIELVRFSDTECYVNEHGHYLKEKHYLIYDDPKHGRTVPLIGTAILFRMTPGGKERDCKLSVETVKGRVQFLGEG
jgi:hypothetical protein